MLIRGNKISIMNPENHCIPGRHRLLGQTTKQTLSNFEQNISDFED